MNLDQIEQEAYKHARQWPIWLVYRIRQYQRVVDAAQTNLPQQPDELIHPSHLGPSEEPSRFEQLEEAQLSTEWEPETPLPQIHEPPIRDEDTQPGLAIARLLADIQGDVEEDKADSPDNLLRSIQDPANPAAGEEKMAASESPTYIEDDPLGYEGSTNHDDTVPAHNGLEQAFLRADDAFSAVDGLRQAFDSQANA